MLYVPKTCFYLKLLTNDEVSYFVAINFSEYFKSIREEQILEKLPNGFVSFEQQ